MMVVPVLITNCQVSLKLKIGPVATHTTMTAAANMNAEGLPVARAVFLAKLVNQEEDLVGLMAKLHMGLGAGEISGQAAGAAFLPEYKPSPAAWGRGVG